MPDCESVNVCVELRLLKASPYSAIEPNNSHRQSIDTKLTGIIVENNLDSPFSNCTYFFLVNSNDFIDTRVWKPVNQLSYQCIDR